ncbi:GOLPH3/VPS74 family protein [Streptomyces indicus]|uniref:Golgi phosphoprotein 3 (GPP34) n=1 Tax=Streptomyces indicus TaxID=417292 RepID=A0A1G9I0U2_9ACTN|nr:GPP34 family phosphoprotein [Streptomyces indicus]SDL18702.1 Golgi phosphoprotein 3 (GPP34) [Streptomyces indicus]
MAVTLAEEIMLLSLDDESGTAKQRQAAAWAVAGGILLELVLAGRVTIDDKHIVLEDTAETGEPLLDERLAQLPGWIGKRGKRHVSYWLTKEQGKAVAPTVARLCERGVLVEEKRKTMGIFPVRRYPEADGAVETELRERLRAVVLEGAEPDVRTAGLVSLIHGAGLHTVAFPGQRKKELAPRMEEVADGQWAGESVRAAIRDMTAVMVAITAATVATAVG